MYFDYIEKREKEMKNGLELASILGEIKWRGMNFLMDVGIREEENWRRIGEGFDR